MKRRWKRIGGVVGFLVVLVAVRAALEPREGPRPQFHPAASERARISEQVAGALLDQARLAQRLRDAKILLLGEEHFTNEIVRYALELLEKVSAPQQRSLVLLLELPQHTQASIDRFLADGREEDFQGIWSDKDALPYQRWIRWAREHRSTVRRVVAMDENRRRIVVMRALLTDTRNESMTQAILKARADAPDALIVAYGGNFHMMRSGRYLYDVANREPVGSRLQRAGVPMADLQVVLMNGEENLPIADAWTRPGAVRTEGPMGELPYGAFFSTHVFGVEKANELFDYFVNVGPLTQGTE